MHTMWKGSISFGLVHIPIKLFAATEDKDIKFRSLHKECKNPIKYEKVCAVCDKEINQDDIVKGYEYEPGKYVIVDPEDIKELTNTSSKRVEIIDFVSIEEIDPIFYNKSYFIGPNENGEKPYSLLKKAIEETGKIGIAKITIRSKQQLAVVRGYKNGLLLETIHWPDEVRNIEHIPNFSEQLEVDERELNMAKTLVEQLTTEFNPDKYTDEYRTGLMDLIESKMKNQEYSTPHQEPETNIIDLMDALQASIDETTPKKKKKIRKKKAVSGE
ncbi:Ku protein [Lottiidibacillus patelloidae]|uniref:Non-homologous end joining protein Ku n=1 Tax=Lottiidibacillus patelloidae TaxID=2670334 RepID=A0A263BUU2_9BACI|nr:Ku protein [Lottiidibacillus patelloidae]OZM57489.1 Ku protein [Lottiidibacillus patelloidae]